MPTVAERQALAFLASVALLGGGMRAWHNHQFSTSAGNAGASVPAAAEGVGDQLRAVDGARQARKERKNSKGQARGASALGETAAPSRHVEDRIIDVDVATVEELERLPRIGPALAARIVANRDSLGPFGSLTELGTVRGIGPAMESALKPLVRFSGAAGRLRNSRAQQRSGGRSVRSK